VMRKNVPRGCAESVKLRIKPLVNLSGRSYLSNDTVVAAIGRAFSWSALLASGRSLGGEVEVEAEEFHCKYE
jgi:hypothetical protein